MSIRQATPEIVDDILKEVDYSRKQLASDLEVFKDWLKSQQHLPDSLMKEPDEYLSNYLTGTKGSLETAKRKIEAYYRFRSLSPLFQERGNIELQKQAARTQFVMCLPEILPNGCVATLIGARDPDINLYDATNTIRWLFASGEYMMRCAGIVRALYVMIDAAGFSASHALRTSPTALRSTVSFLLEAFPIRMKKFIVFNAPVYAETLVNNCVRPFIKQKLNERLIVTSQSIDTVFEYVDHLPEEYGGKAGSVAKLSEVWESAVINWPFLPKLDEKVNESLRPRKIQDYDPYFGSHGSIKALVFD